MASQAPIADSVDPLSGFHGPMLFPRTIRGSTSVPVPADAKDLESVHNFMKSLELRSPEKLMNEAKRIVDGGAGHLESNLSSFTENFWIKDGVDAKGKCKAQERRPGLGLARKRAPFSLKTNNSQPTVNLQPTAGIENLEDPDEYFNNFERMEKAKKEIAKQRGISMDNLKHKRPKHAHPRREGILGRTYNYKHRYPSLPSENDMLNLSPQVVDQDVTGAPNDEPLEKLVHSDPPPDTELEEAELAGNLTASEKKPENDFSGIFQELMSCNSEDLEGDGALNLLQERLKIKPLDLESLHSSKDPRVQHMQKHQKTPPVCGSVLNFLRSTAMDFGQADYALNPASPTPPRSPFASISSLQKRISHPFPLRDPFSPTDDDLSTSQNASPPQPKSSLVDQVEATNDLDRSNAFESCLEVDSREPVDSNVDAHQEMGNADNLPDQFVDENACTKSVNNDFTPNEESDNIEKTMNVDEHNSSPVIQNKTRDDASNRQETETEQQLEVHKSKPPKGGKVSGGNRIRKAHPMRESLAVAGTSFESGVRRSKRIKMRPLEYWKGERFLYGRVDDSFKLLGVKYISPTKDAEKLKVKPYIESDASEFKEILELAARH